MLSGRVVLIAEVFARFDLQAGLEQIDTSVVTTNAGAYRLSSFILEGAPRRPLHTPENILGERLSGLEELSGPPRVEVAGGVRRRLPSVGCRPRACWRRRW
jgi:hypothetical protein